MPRKPQERKIGKHSAEQMRKALGIIEKGTSIKTAAKLCGLPFSTLRRYYHKNKSLSSNEMKLVPNYSVRKIFTEEQELSLKTYVIHCALMFYGLTTKETRILAYQMACTNKIVMPASWRRDQMAGKGWLRSFKKRHPDLSVRKPEACSLARATAFNRENVKIFYNNLENLMKRDPNLANGTRIFNLDETSTTTVQKPQKVIAPKGRKALGKVTSGEKGTLVTTCCIIGASGIAMPPVMVFPRKNFKDYMCKGTPAGTLGLAAPTGWMNAELFVQVMQHFINHSNSSITNPSILVMDNHESHLSIEALNMAKAAGVHILTLHPHTSGKLQPLDVGVFAPFKGYYNAAMESWMLRNPGKPVTIYDIGEIVGVAFHKVMTPSNITNAFKKCGIFPFDRELFDDLDFLPSSVTDRPCPDCEAREDLDVDDIAELPVNRDIDIAVSSSATRAIISSTQPLSSPVLSAVENRSMQELNANNNATPIFSSTSPSAIEWEQALHQTPCMSPVPCSSKMVADSSPSVIEPEQLLNQRSGISPVPSSFKNKEIFISPFEFRNPIKAGPRKSNRKPRKLGKSLIATDTPEKTQIELEKSNIKKRKLSKEKKTTRKIKLSESEDDNDDIFLQNESESDWEEEEENDGQITEENFKLPLPRPPQEGEYVLVEFFTKKQTIYYVGKVLEGRNNSLEYFISFLRRKGHGKFHLPNVPDLSMTKEQDIKVILPKPILAGSTSRQQSYYKFSIDLSGLNIH